MNLGTVDLPNISNLVSGGSGVGNLDSLWVDGSGYRRCHVVVGLVAGGESVTVKVEQATDAAGAGAKVLDASSVYQKSGNAINFTRFPGDIEYTISDTGITTVVLSLALYRMDINNGYRYVRVLLSGATARQQQIVILPMGGEDT